MRLTTLAVPVAALCGAGWLLRAPTADAFSLLGGSLSITQRHVRVFDNFADATANDNTASDPSFPGYKGVELACWKGVVEWGSELHGNGNGDPHQPGGLGSGGANFDACWQGNAAAPGGPIDNIVSAIPGDSSGVLAYTAASVNNNWTIKFFEDAWNWDDGPGTSINGFDLQGVMCHEYGHALGLNHSSVSGATMFPSVSGNGIPQRSLTSDDIAGVQAIYGAKSGAKPRISGIALNGASLVISGANFSGSGNEVWFTKGGSGGNGTPIKVTGVTSNGSSITVAIPTAAGDGDVLVRNNGTSHANLSNAWPVDLAAGFGCGVTSVGANFTGNIGTLTTVSVPLQGSSMTFNVSGLGITGFGRRIIGLVPTNQLVLGFTMLVDYTVAVSLMPFTLTAGSGTFTETMPSLPGVTIFVQGTAIQINGKIVGTNRLDVTVCP